MGCTHSADLKRLASQQEEILRRTSDAGIRRGIGRSDSVVSLISAGSSAVRQIRDDGQYDLFVSHCKKLSESEDRAVWVADVCEAHGFLPFFDRSDLLEVTEAALHSHMRRSNIVVTVLDPLTFSSIWVLKEHYCAYNEGIPIICVYDADRYRWTGQLDRWACLYPWIFSRQVVVLTKTQRRNSHKMLLDAIEKALSDGKSKPSAPLQYSADTTKSIPVKVGVGGSRETDTQGAVESAHAAMLSRLGGEQPSLIVAGFTCTHDAAKVAGIIHHLSPSVPMMGCTSCRGIVLNDRWLSYQKEYAVALWGLHDIAGTYKVIRITNRPKDLSAELRRQVQEACRVRDEMPSFVFLLGSPGDEEAVLKGIVDAIGTDVPILGGSSADNTVAGFWKQISKTGLSGADCLAPEVSESGIVLAVAWPSCEISTTLTSGFRQTEKRGIVTKMDEADPRTILEIDGQPVTQVYNTWAEGKLDGVVFQDGKANVLAPSSFMPLGEPCGDSYHRVLHPAFLHQSTGGLTTFADAREGMPIAMLTAAPETLAKQISESARQLLNTDGGSYTGDGDDTAGALMIFCGGLAMAIDNSMGIAAEKLAAVVGQKATMGICCFGEQGMNHKRQAIHGNLMVGCILFLNKKSKGNRPALERRNSMSWAPAAKNAAAKNAVHPSTSIAAAASGTVQQPGLETASTAQCASTTR
jgi:hypothetical protein